MNYNPIPIQVDVLEAFCLDGERHEPGDRVELAWRHAKQLEKHGKVERVIEWQMANEQMEELRDVLVFTPVLRLEPETVRAVIALDWYGALTLMMQRDNPVRVGDGAYTEREAGRLNHLHQYRRAREQFLAWKYDAMLVIESDIIPPADALVRLAALNVECAYGVYRFRASDVINVFERYPDNNGQRPRNVGESLSCKPHLLKRARSVGRWPCSGAGLGIILIRRRVLEEIDFRLEPNQGGHCDSFFSQDVLTKGFSQAADMRVVCGHKTENGEVLWPRI